MNTDRVEILGVPVDCVDMQTALTVLGNYLDQAEVPSVGKAKSVIAVNPEKVIRCHSDSDLLNQIKNAGLLIPDGIGVVVAARLLAAKKFSRVPGSELMPALCELAQQKQKRVFLFGAKPEVNSKAVALLKETYPALQIAGHQHGYLDETQMPALIDTINQSGADILFVALGSPAQELWMAKYLNRLQVTVCQGVGGTFDVIAGNVKRAPALFRLIHLEWFYRLMAQPKRLLRQTALPKFVYLVFKQKILG